MLPVIRVPTPQPPPPTVSPSSSPGPPGTLHFPGCGSVFVEFLQLPALGRCPVSSLLLFLLQGLQGSLHPPRHSLARIRGVGPLPGHEATSFVKTQHHTSFTCVEYLDLFSLSVMIKVLSDRQCHHISECFHLWASCTFQRSPSASKLQCETYTVYALCHLGLGKLL